MEEAAGAGPDRFAVVGVDTVPGQDDRVGPRGVGAAHHGPGVPGVAHVGADGEQRGPVGRCRVAAGRGASIGGGASVGGGARGQGVDGYVEEAAHRDDALRVHRLGERGQGVVVDAVPDRRPHSQRPGHARRRGAELALERGALALHVGAGAEAHHRERGAVGEAGPIHRAQRSDGERRGALLEGEIDEAHAPDDAHHALSRQRSQLRIVARRGAHGVADVPLERMQQRVVRDDLVLGSGMTSGDELVVSLHRRLDAEGGGVDRRFPHREVQLAAEHRAHRLHRRTRAKQRDQAVGRADGRLGVEGQRALRREAELESLRLQEAAERLAHPAREHHHVEEHRRRHGDAEDGERGPGPVTNQRRVREGGDHRQRPNSASGGVRTSRRAASQPATMPSTSESATASRTMSPVTIEKRSGVRYTPW